jgi:hypothetical protein
MAMLTTLSQSQQYCTRYTLYKYRTLLDVATSITAGASGVSFQPKQSVYFNALNKLLAAHSTVQHHSSNNSSSSDSSSSSSGVYWAHARLTLLHEWSVNRGELLRAAALGDLLR